MQKTDFHVFELFCRKSHLELKCTKITSLELLRTPILCFSATKQIMKMRGHRCSKHSFSAEKKLLNAILRAKLKHMKNVLSNEMNSFLQCRRQIFMSFELILQKKSF